MDVGQEFVFRFGPALSMYRSGISFLFNTGIAKPAVRNEVASLLNIVHNKQAEGGA